MTTPPKVTARFNNILRRSTFDLPSNLTPAGRRCIQIEIPDDDEHEAAFYGAISLLMNWTSWRRDNDKSGAVLAEYWRGILTGQPIFDPCASPDQPIYVIEEEEHDMIRLKPGNSCIIQMWCAPDQEWQDWLDVSTCAALSAPGAVTQPAPGGTLAPNACVEYNVTLQGNSSWLLPVPVIDGYVVTVTAVSGGWNDGDLFDGWFCPNGQDYFLGACAGVQYTDGSDPAPSLYHGQLIMGVAGSYFDPLSGPVTLSGISGAQNLIFQMNDPSLSDNSGSIQFHVEVCANEDVVWCQSFTDFSTWSSPSGYAQGTGATALGKAFGFGTFDIFKLEVNYTGTGPTGGASAIASWYAEPGSISGGNRFDFQGPVSSFTGHYEWNGSQSLDALTTGLNSDGSVGDFVITEIILHGSGTNPFGADNC